MSKTISLAELLPDQTIVNGHRISVGHHAAENPSENDVVLIHGTPSHSFIWREVVPLLNAAGCNVYLFDLLGYGKSERPLGADTSVAAQGNVLLKLLDFWSLQRPHIVGHDIAGCIGLRHAVFYQDRLRSLTVIDACTYDSWPSQTWQEIIANHLDSYAAMAPGDFKNLLAKQLKMTVHNDLNMSGEVLDAYLGAISGPIGQPSFFRHQVSHYNSRYSQEITDKLKSISCPVQILWGANDLWQPVHWAKRLHADIPGSTLTIIPDAGHFLMEDAPDQVASLTAQFIQAHAV